MPQTIMIFGAGINQATLIDSAKELGLNVLVIDPKENPLCKARADFFYQVAGDDHERTKYIALKHNVAGIITGQMERPLRLMARLAREMGFIFHSPEVVERATNKYLMKRAFISAGIPCAQGELIYQGKILSENEFNWHALPMIIKPLNAFSSRGVYRIEDYNGYLDKIASTLSFSGDGSYLIEEFIEGPEYSIETITYKGKSHVIQYTEKLITPYPDTVEIGHFQPADLSDLQKEQITLVVTKALNALEIDNSAAHTELKWTAAGPVIIEIGPRLGGDFISSYLTLASTGINLEKAAIQVALGDCPAISVTKEAGSAIKYMTLKPESMIKDISPGITETAGLPNVLHYHLDIKIGDIVLPLTDSAKRPGWVITKGDNPLQARLDAEDALAFMKNHITLSEDQ